MRYIEYDSVSMSSRSSPVMNVLTSSSLICSVIRLSLPRARANSCSGCGWLPFFSNSTSSRVKRLGFVGAGFQQVEKLRIVAEVLLDGKHCTCSRNFTQSIGRVIFLQTSYRGKGPTIRSDR